MSGMDNQRLRVAALYRFGAIDDLEGRRDRLLSLMKRQGVLGTILLAQEGVNGTICGQQDAIEAVVEQIRRWPAMHDLQPKYSWSDTPPFAKARVKIKPEIVSFGPAVDPEAKVGEYIDPQQWDALISQPDVVLIDCRNRYEYNLGTFDGAIDPQTDSFREFPDYVKQNLDPAKHKKVAMFCTGGIRCEKATSWMLEQGFENVYHLKGGVLNYLEQVPAENSRWQGECFVFDDRVTVDHDLVPSHYDICPNCRMPIMPGERELPEYEENMSCVRCYHRLTPQRRASLSERRKQQQLAAEKVKVSHHGTVVLSHGLESSPQSTKIRTLKPLAEKRGWRVVTPDYRSTNDPAERVEILLRQGRAIDGVLVLAGSSMGGLVSVVASRSLQVSGLFLIAPAVYFPGYEDEDYSARVDGPISIIHGWSDTTCPIAGSQRFARENSARLVAIEGDHLLHAVMPDVAAEFVLWLEHCARALASKSESAR